MVSGEKLRPLEAKAQLIRLRAGELDSYHQRQADRNGYLYMLVQEFGRKDTFAHVPFMHVKSLATGKEIVLYSRWVERAEDPDGTRLPG